MALIKCPECGGTVSDTAKSCPHCGAPIDTAFRCPKCGSTSVSKISGVSKAASFAAFGVLSAKKLTSQYKCNNCGNKF